jgi:CRISPR-associated endonuclease/helicase Cas3
MKESKFLSSDTMSDYLAKPDQTLQEHSLRAHNVLCRVLAAMPDFQIPENIAQIVLLHDIGKINRAFQDALRNSGTMEEQRLYRLRHELISGLVYYLLNPSDLSGTMAIYSHHKRLNPGTFDMDRSIPAFFDANDMHQVVKELLRSAKLPVPEDNILNKIEQIPNNPDILCICFNKLIGQLADSPPKRDNYITKKALLYYADWMSSGDIDPSPYFDYPKINQSVLTKKISDRINAKLVWHEYQQRIVSQTGDVLLIAPTGSGKTEAALLWAGSNPGRLVYLLPTRVTTNAIYERLNQYNLSPKTALVHSHTSLYMYENERDFTWSDHLLSKCLAYPISVGTIDQILSAGFNVGYWELKEFNLRNARIVIDEIHTFDPFAMGLLISYISHLKNHGASFFIMSATIPAYLVKLLQKSNSNLQIVEAAEFSEIRKNKIVLIDDASQVEAMAVEAYRQGKKVLLVHNTVNAAIRSYQSIKTLLGQEDSCRLMCYHARFIYKDRGIKEKQINSLAEDSEACILVATQVVEVSLDIDFDLLISENAPIDALIQRIGRINRRGKKQDSSVCIFEHNRVSEMVYNRDILQRSLSQILFYQDQHPSEKDFVKMVDEVYSDYDPESDPLFQQGLVAHREIQRLSLQIMDFAGDDSEKHKAVTRALTYIKIPVIPACFHPELRESNRFEKVLHQVDIPQNWLKKLGTTQKFKDSDDFLYCSFDYSFEIGMVQNSENFLNTNGSLEEGD